MSLSARAIATSGIGFGALLVAASGLLPVPADAAIAGVGQDKRVTRDSQLDDHLLNQRKRIAPKLYEKDHAQPESQVIPRRDAPATSYAASPAPQRAVASAAKVALESAGLSHDDISALTDDEAAAVVAMLMIDD